MIRQVIKSAALGLLISLASCVAVSSLWQGVKDAPLQIFVSTAVGAALLLFVGEFWGIFGTSLSAWLVNHFQTTGRTIELLTQIDEYRKEIKRMGGNPNFIPKPEPFIPTWFWFATSALAFIVFWRCYLRKQNLGQFFRDLKEGLPLAAIGHAAVVVGVKTAEAADKLSHARRIRKTNKRIAKQENKESNNDNSTDS